jgi:hypothetical protein
VTMHTQLRTWLDQTVHHQQFQHLGPRHAFTAARQFAFPG